MRFSSVATLTAAALCAAAGQLLFKVGAQGAHHFLDFINRPIASGLILYGAGTLLWIYALSFEKLVNVYAFTALTFVLVYLGGVLLIRESITTTGIAGVGCVLIGLYLITSQPQ